LDKHKQKRSSAVKTRVYCCELEKIFVSEEEKIKHFKKPQKSVYYRKWGRKF